LSLWVSKILNLVAIECGIVVYSDVAGLILVNPLPEDLFSYDNGVWSDNWCVLIICCQDTVSLCRVCRVAWMINVLKFINLIAVNHQLFC